MLGSLDPDCPALTHSSTSSAAATSSASRQPPPVSAAELHRWPPVLSAAAHRRQPPVVSVAARCPPEPRPPETLSSGLLVGAAAAVAMSAAARPRVFWQRAGSRPVRLEPPDSVSSSRRLSSPQQLEVHQLAACSCRRQLVACSSSARLPKLFPLMPALSILVSTIF